MIKLYYIYISMLACMCLVPTAINDTCAQVTFWHRLEHLLVFATFPRVQIWDLGSRSRPQAVVVVFFVIYVIALHFFCSRKLSENQISAANFYLKHEKHICHMFTKIPEILPKKSGHTFFFVTLLGPRNPISRYNGRGPFWVKLLGGSSHS